MAETQREMSCREAGSLGGQKVRDEGLVDYQAIGRKGGATTKERHGTEHFVSMGRKGGEATAKRHGMAFYEAIGKKGGARVRELIQRAKDAGEDGSE